MLIKAEEPRRKTGIDILGDVSWGRHFCLFYKTEEDLLSILIPYFKAGLESNEFCMWVTSEPLGVKEVEETLRRSILNLDQYQKNGQLVIIPHCEWYLKGGTFDLQRTLNVWVDRLNQALATGFAGMRVTGNGSGFKKGDWEKLADYEREVNNAISKHRMIAICSYRINECGAAEIIDMVDCHQSAIIKREGKWEVIESFERKEAEKRLEASESRYITLLENLPQKIFLKDKNSVYISCNENYARDLKIKAEEIVGKTDYDFFPKDLAEKYRADDKRIMDSGRTEDINEKYIQQGKEIFVHTVKTPVRDEEGSVTGILGIFWDVTVQRRSQKKLLDYQKRLRNLTSEMSLTEERERRRLAVELHDQITQQLILFKMSLGSLVQKELPPELVEPLNGVYQRLDQMIQDTRLLTFDLSPPTLYELGLEAAIREWLHEEIQKKHKIHAEFDDDGQPKPLDDDVRALLYRAVRELLVNVVKHAQAQNVKVAIVRNNNNVRIRVVDDGIGFVPQPQLNKTGGFGLFSIRERMNYIGGNIEVESKSGQGTHVTLMAPIKREKKRNL